MRTCPPLPRRLAGNPYLALGEQAGRAPAYVGMLPDIDAEQGHQGKLGGHGVLVGRGNNGEGAGRGVERQPPPSRTLRSRVCGWALSALQDQTLRVRRARGLPETIARRVAVPGSEDSMGEDAVPQAPAHTLLAWMALVMLLNEPLNVSKSPNCSVMAVARAPLGSV